jgi:hypothetical protein
MRRLAVPILVSAFGILLSAFAFFFHRDNFSTHYPIKSVSAAAFRAGEIPFWNPFDGGGQPLAGNPNTLTFYPDNFLYLVLPAHAAFNVHFLLHLAAGWLAMRALARSTFAAWVLVLSGVAISAMSFYSLITAIALIPFALLAAERRSALQLGLAFGLMALAGEPVTILATALACAIVRFSPQMIAAIPLATAIALPQILAYAEIARETERGGHGYSARTVLAASLEPKRLLELLIGPFLKADSVHLFPTLVIGVIVIPALLRRSRYTIAALVMLFFALGRFNPAVRWIVETFGWLRIGRYPEKFALPMCVLLIVLAAEVQRRARVWTWITLVPLIAWAVFTLPIDLFSYYRVPSRPPVRVYAPPPVGGQEIDRADYRERARRLDPIFGAVAGVRYALNRSPDGMHSLLSRIAAERWATTRNPHWLQIALAPDAVVVPRAVGAHTIPDVVNTIESAAFDPRQVAVAPMRLNGFVSTGRITRMSRGRDWIELDVAGGPALVLINESYFRAWGSETFPLDLDRLGVIAPPGRTRLQFGQWRTAVVAAWVLSNALLLLGAFLLVQKLDRRPREVERPADEH